MPAHYSDGTVISPLDADRRILVQIAINTGGPLYEDGTVISPLDSIGRILAQIALNTE